MVKSFCGLIVTIHDGPFDGWADLAIASFLGLRDMVKWMLVVEKVDAKTPGGRLIGCALNAAVLGLSRS
ncbi:hypothetical protein G3M48_006351 [Beauveria asiatica]|uniref:Uncharacterized protein n=1 Tax=Beauveria asiatica TaxID=1069075 RepID=A0AAW0S4W2_9HYPO